MAATTGEKIRLARERLVIGQAELARAAGLTQSAIWHIERGGREPRPVTIRKLAAALSQLSGEPVRPLDIQGEELAPDASNGKAAGNGR